MKLSTLGNPKRIVGNASQLAIMILLTSGVSTTNAQNLHIPISLSHIAQRGKANEKKSSIPQPNKITLSATKFQLARTGCAVTAWVRYVPTSGTPMPTAGYIVNFVKVSGPGGTPPTGVSDKKGEVNVIIPWDTIVRATVQSYALLTSNEFGCEKKPQDDGKNPRE